MRDWYHIKRRYVVSFEGKEVEFLSHFRPGVYLLNEDAEEALVKAGHHPGGWDDFEIRKTGRSLRAPFHLKGENMAKKQGYYISENVNGAVARYVSGYVYEKDIAGMTMRFGVRKDERGNWTVDELGTGMQVNPGHKFGTRKEALEYVNGKDAQTGRSLVEALATYLEKHPYRYKAEMWALQVLQQRKTPWPMKERNAYVDKRAREIAEAAGAVKPEKKEEQVEKVNINGEHVCITGTLPGMTRKEAFARLKAVGGVPCERFNKKVTLFVITDKAGRDKRKKLEKAIADGQEMRVIEGHEFLEALKEAEAEQAAKAVEQAAKRKGAKIDVKVHPEEGGVQAIEMTPKKEERMEDLKKQLEKVQAELRDMKANAFMWETQAKENEKELKAARKELDGVWKENANLKAKREPKDIPPAPKAPNEKEQDAAATVSLEQMQAWCEGKGLKAKQTNEASSIWVLGPSKPYKDELIEMGARWGTSKKYGKGWYINPSAA